jgi:hypothetical protein
MKTKNKYIFLILSILILAGIGCKKSFLDTKIDTAQTPETINSNYSTLAQFAAAPYVYLRNEFSILDNNLFAAASDEAVQTAASSNASLFNRGSWNATNNPDNYYASYYAGIRAANYFIENSVNYKTILASNRDTFSNSGNISYYNDVASIGWYRAEAHILRAFFYFELSKRYGGVPLVTKVLSATDNTNIPKSSYDSIINFIVNEVDANKDSLQTNWKTSSFANYDGRLSKGPALALKARALLYAASPLHNATNDASKWKKAATALNEIIIFASGAGGYAVTTNYGNYFLNNTTLTDNETIWAVRYAANNTLETRNYPIATSGGNSGITPTQNLVADYEYNGTPDLTNPYKNRDPRLANTIVTNNSTWNGRTIVESAGGTDDMANTNASKTGFYLKKFLTDNLNLTQSQTVVHNWPVFRYCEVLLEYAEAMNEAYGTTNDNGYGLTALAALNKVRTRTSVAMPASTTLDQVTLRAVIKHERKIELAFENYRYWDLLRWKDAETILSQPIQGVKIIKNSNGTYTYSSFNVESRVFDASKMYYYPFPQTEINKSNGVLIQNTGW